MPNMAVQLEIVTQDTAVQAQAYLQMIMDTKVKLLLDPLDPMEIQK